ncbi:MAG: arylamine N-acetyltransferase [Acidimicrobiales bacterium]
MTRTWVDDYLERIDATRPRSLDERSLSNLQAAHIGAVPFENLSIHLGEPIVLDPTKLVDKIVRLRRGGLCYELNGAFATLLGALGFPVTFLAARVIGADGLGPPFDHMALRVDLDDAWLVDVGYGRDAPYRPLRLGDRSDQPDRAGFFRLVDADEGDVEVLCDNRRQYILETRPRELTAFEATCWWHQTSPRSPFTAAPLCTLPTPDGRVTLAGRELIRTTGDNRVVETIGDDEALLQAYQRWFDIRVDRVPTSKR